MILISEVALAVVLLGQAYSFVATPAFSRWTLAPTRARSWSPA